MSNAKPKSSKIEYKRLALVVVGVAITAGLIWGAITWFKANYAEEIARPLEQSLINMGAVKKCTQGDPGRGPDNLSPGYNVVFETNVKKDEVVERVKSLAKENGYTLAYERSPNEHIDWYSDKTSRDSPYSDLQSGKIQLGVNFYSGGSNLGCPGGVAVNYDKDHTAVSLSVSLPEFKAR